MITASMMPKYNSDEGIIYILLTFLFSVGYKTYYQHGIL